MTSDLTDTWNVCQVRHSAKGISNSPPRRCPLGGQSHSRGNRTVPFPLVLLIATRITTRLWLRSPHQTASLSCRSINDVYQWPPMLPVGRQWYFPLSKVPVRYLDARLRTASESLQMPVADWFKLTETLRSADSESTTLWVKQAFSYPQYGASRSMLVSLPSLTVV